jgi:hypothetical protein
MKFQERNGRKSLRKGETNEKQTYPIIIFSDSVHNFFELFIQAFAGPRCHDFEPKG